MSATRNKEENRKLISFLKAHENHRVWQNIRNWSGKNYVLVSDLLPDEPIGAQDTFHWETRTGI